MNNPIGTIYSNAMPTVIVHNGMRGPQGVPGDEGDQGDPGDSINMRGQWQSGASYAGLDAVTWRSSTMDGFDSLYIQLTAWPDEISTVEPQDDPARWSEIGLSSEEGLLGSVWIVDQAGHPFSKVGQPAALSGGGYVLASANDPTRVAIALVREVISANRFILQSSGGIPNVDPTVTIGTLTDGQFYYVSATAGFLTEDAPTGAGQWVQAIYQHGPDPDGVVLPWTPDLNAVLTEVVDGSRERFYYSATDGQVDFTGADLNGNTPDFTGGIDLVECYQNGLNLWEAVDYTVTPTTLTLAAPAALDDRVEISVLTPNTPMATGRDKLDKLAFDGMQTEFMLQIAGVDISYMAAQFFEVYLDGNPQEPEVDYTVNDAGGQAQIKFTFAPEIDTNNWIIRDTG